MKKIIITGVFILLIAAIFAQEKGCINKTLLNSMRDAFQNNEANKSLMNAVSGHDIRKLALNRENIGKIDKYFSHRVKSQGITNQNSSGRCWLFTGMNILRAKVINEKNLEKFNFSHNYNFFFDQLEKSNLFLEEIIVTADKPIGDKKVEWLFKNTISDGGQWTGVVDIITKYGVVPAEVFAESFNSDNTRWMLRFITRKLRENGLELRKMYSDGKSRDQLRKVKEKMLSDVYKILAVSLGEPPSEFEWRYKDKDDNLSELKTYTPLSFYKEFVAVNLDDYVMFMNDPTREYGKVYEIENDRHVYEGENWKYINLDVESIKVFAVNSIKANEAMYFSCDVGKQFDKDRGYLDINNYNYEALFGVNFTMDKKQRIQTFESGSTHGMALVAVDLQENLPSKWLLENSWGDSGFNGHLIMTDQWFDEYMFRLVVHKRFIDEKTLNILKKDAIILPPWDPMFSADN